MRCNSTCNSAVQKIQQARLMHGPLKGRSRRTLLQSNQLQQRRMMGLLLLMVMVLMLLLLLLQTMCWRNHRSMRTN